MNWGGELEYDLGPAHLNGIAADVVEIVEGDFLHGVRFLGELSLIPDLLGVLLGVVLRRVLGRLWQRHRLAQGQGNQAQRHKCVVLHCSEHNESKTIKLHINKKKLNFIKMIY